jgi:hypothetical protein
MIDNTERDYTYQTLQTGYFKDEETAAQATREAHVIHAQQGETKGHEDVGKEDCSV